MVPEVPQGGVPHDFVVGENLVGRKHGIGKSVADAYARHAGLVGEAFGDGRPGVAPVPSRGEAASGKAGQAGGLLEGKLRGDNLVDLLGSSKGESLVPSLERMLEMVIGKKSLLAFLTSNWYGL